MLFRSVSQSRYAAGVTDSTNSWFVGGGGKKSLAGVIDRLRVTTVNGTDTFDAGSIGVLVEG